MDLKSVAAYGPDSTYTPDRLIMHDAARVLAKGITLLSGAVLGRGTVLGMITATSKYTIATSTASDGSQTPTAILAEDTDASAGDRNTTAYFKGTFNEGAFILGAGLTISPVRAALRGIGIYTDISTP